MFEVFWVLSGMTTHIVQKKEKKEEEKNHKPWQGSVQFAHCKTSLDNIELLFESEANFEGLCLRKIFVVVDDDDD